MGRRSRDCTIGNATVTINDRRQNLINIPIALPFPGSEQAFQNTRVSQNVVPMGTTSATSSRVAIASKEKFPVASGTTSATSTSSTTTFSRTLEWLRMTQNGPELLGMAQNYSEWLRIAENGSEWLRVD